MKARQLFERKPSRDPLPRLVAFVWLIFCLVILAGCEGDDAADSTNTGAHELTLFVAASLTDVVREVGEAFEQRKNVALSYNFASSGALAQQLLASPRADLFFSANERWMSVVEEKGLLESGSRRAFLSNQLVVVANKRAALQAASPTDLCDVPFALLAMGDPAHVPAGRYAQQWLESVACPDGETLWNRVEGKVSPAPDVRASLAQVEGSQDVVGIVYRTDFTARRDDVRLLFEVPIADAPEIRYSVGIVDSSRAPSLARQFLEFATSSEAKAIFEKHGFVVAFQ